MGSDLVFWLREETKLKAVQLHAYGGVDQLFYEDVPDPKPGAGEVLVKVAATSINPVDWKLRQGDFKDRMPMQLPANLGRDVAGTVVSLGSGAQGFQPGRSGDGSGQSRLRGISRSEAGGSYRAFRMA